jgi:hypothetical protein
VSQLRITVRRLFSLGSLDLAAFLILEQGCESILIGRGCARKIGRELVEQLQTISVFKQQKGGIHMDTKRFLKRLSLTPILLAPAVGWSLVLGLGASTEGRVINVQISAPTIAFGGYSWPGVGRYVKITGTAYAEVDPNDRRNNVIVDIGLAQTQPAALQPGKTPNGKVAYLLNFYILKPENLNQVD